MKLPLLTTFAFILAVLTGCTGNDNTSFLLQNKVDSLANIVKEQENIIKLQRDTIFTLQYPADQRLAQIKRLISEEKFSQAKSEISELQNIFPNSSEAADCPALLQSISEKEAAIAAEQERIRALGFKAIKTESTIKIGENTVTFSNFNIGNKYIHDVYPTYTGSEWREHTADRDNKYISYSMDVKSTSKNPNIPTLAFYSIHGGELTLEDTFRVDMARWQDYGTYLGNEPDLNNDFSKVSTVKFKVGCELPEQDFLNPYIVVLKKANTQTRYYERMRNPPVYYTGPTGYPQNLSLEDFTNGDYVAIKIANLK